MPSIIYTKPEFRTRVNPASGLIFKQSYCSFWIEGNKQRYNLSAYGINNEQAEKKLIEQLKAKSNRLFSFIPTVFINKLPAL